MKKYFFITGLIIIFINILVIYLFGIANFNFKNYISLAFFFAFIFYYKYYNIVNTKFLKILKSVLILFSIFIYFWIIFICGYMIINYPEEKKFEEKLILPHADKNWEENYYLLAEKLLEYQKKYQNKIKIDKELIYQYRSEPAIESLLEKTYNDRKKIIDFIISNNITLPEKEINFYSVTPKSLEIMNIFKLELIEITKYINEGNFDAAEEKYTKLWHFVQSNNNSNLTMILYIVNTSCIDLLINFYFNSEIKLLNSRNEIIDMIKSIDRTLEDKGKISFRYEYQYLRKILKNNDAEFFKQFNGLTDQNLKFIFFNNGWPFYDQYKTWRIYHEIFYKLELLFQKPFYSLSDGLKDYENFIKKNTEFSYFINPIGQLVLTFSTPCFSGAILKKEILKSKINLFLHILNSSDKELLDNIPTDNLTGRPYKIIKNDASTIIKSECTDKNYNGEINFKIKTNL